MELLERVQILEDKQAIQDLTNEYLQAADKKDHKTMANCFAPTGKLTSIMNSGTIVLDGKQNIATGFEKILFPISVAYHMAGQLKIELAGENATGTSYCFVTLISSENNVKYVHKIWAVYNDKYVKENGKWLIVSRLATVSWEEKNNFN